jgi:hypothetical protein
MLTNKNFVYAMYAAADCVIGALLPDVQIFRNENIGLLAGIILSMSNRKETDKLNEGADCI